MATFLRKMHEPVCRYDADVYNHLCTVIQALPLAVLFWVFVEKGVYDEIGDAFVNRSHPFPFIEVAKMVIVISSVCLIWHRYVVDSRFIAWRLSILDTLIPFGFAIAQSLLALSVYGSTLLFAIWISVLAALGVAAYWQLRSKFQGKHALALYRNHFGEPQGSKIYNDVDKYFADWRRNLFLYFVATLGAVLISLPWNCTAVIRINNIDFVIVAILAALIIIHLFSDTLNTRLEPWFNTDEEQVVHTTSLDQAPS
jgi:hypothetical protein